MPPPRAAFLLPLLLTTSCSSPTLLRSLPVPAQNSTRLLNIPYGPHPRQKLDVYTPTHLLRAAHPARNLRQPPTAPSPSRPRSGLPHRDTPRAAPPTPKPLIIFFYGGYWQSGDRANYHFAAYAFTSAGYPAAVPDYRLHPEVSFPAFLDDAARAVAHLRTHAQDYGADPDRIVLVGHSAGGYIATLLNLDPQYLARYNVPRQSIKAVISLSAPFYFTPFKDPTMQSIFSKDEAQWPPTQPATFLDKPDPHRAPMLLIQGHRDHLVNPADAPRLARALRATGTQATSLSYPTLNHIDPIAALIWPLWPTTDIRPHLLRFIKQHTTLPPD